jgi:hypothetical protein
MRRSLGLLLLLVSFFWQSAALAGGRWMPELAQDPEHAALHWQDSAHHHHDDGSYHVEDSGDAFAHVQFDAASGGAALLPSAVIAPGAVARGSPAFSYLLILPSPPADSLRRPPRTVA